MSFTNITDIFSGATVSSGNVIIPSGTIVSYVPSSTSNPAPAEMVFGLLETLARKVTSEGLTHITCTSSTSLTNSSTLTKFYSFTVNLDFSSNSVIESLNVKAEPQA